MIAPSSAAVDKTLRYFLKDKRQDYPHCTSYENIRALKIVTNSLVTLGWAQFSPCRMCGCFIDSVGMLLSCAAIFLFFIYFSHKIYVKPKHTRSMYAESSTSRPLSTFSILADETLEAKCPSRRMRTNTHMPYSIQ